MGAYYTAHSLHEVITAVRISPIVMGILWPDEWFDVGDDGMMYLKRDSSGKVLNRFGAGGHAMEINGLNEHKGYFRTPNSWGRGNWGDRGQGYLPFEDAEWHIEKAGGRFVYGTEIDMNKLKAIGKAAKQNG